MNFWHQTGLSLPRSLWFLLKLQWKARMRQSRRSLRTTRGKIYGVIMGLMFCLWLLPSLVTAFLTPRSDQETTLAFFAPALFAFSLLTILTSTAESGVFFMPAEVDMLFPGPFRRRELLIYRIVSLCAGGSLVALVFSAILLRCVTYWIAAYVGLALGLIFLNLLQLALGILASTLAEAAYTRWRKVVLVAGLLLLAWGISQALRTADGGGPVAIASALRTSLPGRILLAPFDVIAHAATATRLFPDFIGWTLVAVHMNVGMLWLILSLDSNYMEKSIGASQRMYERLQRARRGQGLAGAAKARGRLRSMRFPFLGGAGPIAWRQLTTALRNSHVVFLLIGVVAVAITLPFLFLMKDTSRLGGAVAGPVVSMFVFLLPQLLQYDFRGDLDRLDVLKSLPLSPWGVVLGQLFTPVFLASTIMGLVLVALSLAGLLNSAWYIPVGFLIVPTNLFLFSIENLMFLIFPFQMQTNVTGDLQVVGRNMLSAVCKIAAMMVGIGIALGIGTLFYFLTDEAALSYSLGMVVAFLVMTGILIPLTVLFYHRLDPASTHSV